MQCLDCRAMPNAATSECDALDGSAFRSVRRKAVSVHTIVRARATFARLPSLYDVVSQFAAIRYVNLLLWKTRCRPILLCNRMETLQTFKHFADYHTRAIEPVGLRQGNGELGVVAVAASVEHCHDAWAHVLQYMRNVR
jgi:hypothetical protein